MSATIPRFLLPRRSSIWRQRVSSQSLTTSAIRNASNKAPKKSVPAKKPAAKAALPKIPVLEKPAKFNPPSHPQRLNQRPRHFAGAPLTADQKAAQATKRYPHMMPQPGTVLHSFLHSRSIHIWITLGTLTSLAAFTFITNFKRNSPFADMLPPASDLFWHPTSFWGSVLEVMKLDSDRTSAETAERRKRKVEDVVKRGAYRKAHGLETEGFGGWQAKNDAEDLGPAIELGEGGLSEAVVATGGGQAPVEEELRTRRPVKKWFGIW